MPPKNRFDIEGRRQHVAAMLLENKSERQIARALSIGVATACRDIAAVRSEWQERRLTDVGQWVAEENARLDVAMAAIWPKILTGDTWHIDRMLAIMERRAKYLGLDAKVDALPAAQMQVVILNGDGRTIDANSLAALWSRGGSLLPERSGDHAEWPGEHGEIERVS